MEFSKNETEDCIKKIQQKQSSAICMMCGGHEWNLANNVFELREHFPGGKIPKDTMMKILPVVAFTCNNCGNTLLLAAYKLGITEAQKELPRE